MMKISKMLSDLLSRRTNKARTLTERQRDNWNKRHTNTGRKYVTTDRAGKTHSVSIYRKVA